MEEDAPPDDPVRDYTAALHKRPRTADSHSSTSAESIHSTRTLQSEDLEFVHENGRVYGNTSWIMPCDQEEQDRLTIQHQVFVLALKGKLTTTPIHSNTKWRILDVGTGPGNWAVAMAQRYPFAEVVGTDMAVWDLETTEGDSGGGRVQWEIDDLDVWDAGADIEELSSRLANLDPFRKPSEYYPSYLASKPSTSQTQSCSTEPGNLLDLYDLEPDIQPGWHFGDTFDLIHLRNSKGVFAYWEEVYAEAYRSLSPGGYIEVADYEIMLPEMDGSQVEPGETSIPITGVAPEEAPLPTVRKLYTAGMSASWKNGRQWGTSYMHPTYLEEAGFKDVKTTCVNVPVGIWPEDETQRRIGKMFLVVVMELFEPHLLRLLTRYGDGERVWTPEEVRHDVETAKQEIMEWSEVADQEKSKEGWCAMFKWVTGRKSMDAV